MTLFLFSSTSFADPNVAGIHFLEVDLIKTNKQLRAVCAEINTLEEFQTGYAARSKVVSKTLIQAKFFRNFTAKTLRVNINRKLLGVTINTLQQTIDGFGGLGKNIGKFLGETLFNFSVDQAFSSLSEPYKVKVATFKDESVNVFPRLRRIQRLMELEDAQIRNLALAKDGKEVTGDGIVLWKVNNLLMEVKAIVPEIETYLENLIETKEQTDAELARLRPIKMNLQTTARDLAACIATRRQEQRDMWAAEERTAAAQALGAPNPDPLPTVSPQEEMETALDQYRKYYAAAAASLMAEWPGLLAQIHQKRIAYLTGLCNVHTNTLSEAPLIDMAPEVVTPDFLTPSLKELIVAHDGIKTELNTIYTQDNIDSINRARMEYVALRACLDQIAQLDLRKTELEQFALSVNELYVTLVGGVQATEDNMVHFLNELPKPEGFDDEIDTIKGFDEEFVTLDQIASIRRNDAALETTKELIEDAMMTLPPGRDELEAAFNALLQKRRSEFQELEDAISQYRSAFNDCAAAAQSWDTFLLAQDYGFENSGQDSFIFNDSNGQSITSGHIEFDRNTMINDLAFPEMKGSTFQAILQIYNNIIDAYNIDNTLYILARYRLQDAQSFIEAQGNEDFPHSGPGFSFYDADWFEASLLEDRCLKAPLPDLSDFNQIRPMLENGSVFRDFRSLIYPGVEDDPDWAKAFERMERTLDSLGLVSPAVIYQTLDELYALAQQINEEDRRAYLSWIDDINFYAADQQFNHSFPPNQPPASPPTINVQPGSLMVSAGTPARLTVQASGEGILLYSWAEMIDDNFSILLPLGFRPYLDLPSEDEPVSYLVTVSNGHQTETQSVVVTVTPDMSETLMLGADTTMTPSAGDSHMLPVTASDTMLDWVIRPQVSWITVVGSAARRGIDTFTFQTAANNTSGPREGEIHIGDQVHTVFQDFTPESFNAWNMNNQNQDPNMDQSGDGLSQFFNFAMGTNPMNDNTDKKPALQLMRDGQSGSIAVIQYRRSKTIGTLDFTVRCSSILGQWTNAEDAVHYPNGEDGGSWIYNVEIPIGSTDELRFYQVTVSEQAAGP